MEDDVFVCEDPLCQIKHVCYAEARGRQELGRDMECGVS